MGVWPSMVRLRIFPQAATDEALGIWATTQDHTQWVDLS